MYGDDYEYANTRLAETIVRLGEDPVFIHAVEKGMKVMYSRLDQMDEFDPQAIELAELDLHPVKLGYINVRGGCDYLTRYPMRRDWRQGLRRGNFGAIGGVLDPMRISYKDLDKCIRGQYPSFARVLAAKSSAAWHREWAVKKLPGEAPVLWYKGQKEVGTIDDGVPVLSERFIYLREALKEAL